MSLTNGVIEDKRSSRGYLVIGSRCGGRGDEEVQDVAPPLNIAIGGPFVLGR